MTDAERSGIDLDAAFHRRGYLKMMPDEVSEIANLIGLKVSGRAAAEMDLDDLAAVIESRLEQGNLLSR